MMQPIALCAPDAVAFAPYGRFVTPPALPGTRAFYSDAFAVHPQDTAAVVHVNHVPESRLPLMATTVERHPHAAQCFIPLDVARYAVVVMVARGWLIQASVGGPGAMGGRVNRCGLAW